MKREANAHQGRIETTKKQKLRKFCQTKDRYGTKTAFNVRAGMRGILVFCDRNKEKQSVRECNTIFHELAAELHPEVNLVGVNSSSEAESETEDIEASINKEIQEIKAKKQKGTHLFSACKIQIDCLTFFKTKEPIEPVSFIHTLLSRVKETGITGTKFVSRLVPLEYICQANIKDVEEFAKKLIAPHFQETCATTGAIIPKTTFAIVFNSRLCTNIKKTETIDIVAKLVSEPHKVNLTTPDITIIIEAFKNVCGISVVKDFHSLKKYNIQLVGDLARKRIEESATSQEDKS